MRHAKSSWAHEGLSDHARPLDARGRRDAPRIAQDLASVGWAPDLALVSDAARTEETWAWMAEHLEITPFMLVPSLYHGSLGDIRAAVLARVVHHRTVLVLGHNPGWEDALEALCGRRHVMKTAYAALLSHRAPWSEALGRRDWRFRGMIGPGLDPVNST